jgi:hypothetical protein
MPRITHEEVTAEPWKYTASQYQAVLGVHQPYIAEISPMQYAHLSNRGKAQYDAKRSREWDASAVCKRQWATAIVAAFDAGTFTLDDPQLSRDAKDAVIWASIERKKAERAARLEEAERANIIRDFSMLKPGDRVWSLIGGHYLTVTKVNTKSVRARYDYPEGHFLHGMDTKLTGALYRVAPRDLDAQIA